MQTGKAFEKFGDMRSREMTANWLLCVVKTAIEQRPFTFTTDPVGGDGIILDEKSGETWPTEHVLVPRQRGADGADLHALVLDAIKQKCAKGAGAYATGKTLVVFMNAAGEKWYPNRVAKALPEPLHFGAVWTAGLQCVEDGDYVYNVALLDVTQGNAPAFSVRIKSDFRTWTVAKTQ